MKKAFVFLLILGVCFQAAAEIKFGGEVDAGVGVMSGSEDYMPEDTTALLSVQSVSAKRSPFRIRLNGEYQNEEGFLGANVRLQIEETFGIGYAYGWIKAFGGKFVSNAGFIDNTDFDYMADPFDEDTDEGLGLMTIVSPIDNLKIGAAAYAAPTPDDFAAMSDYAGLDIRKAKYSLSASFELPKMFRFVTTWSPGIDNWDDLLSGNPGVWGADDNTGKFMAGLTFTGIDRLTLLGGVTMWNLIGGTLNEYQERFGILRFEAGAIFETEKLGPGDLTAVLASRILLPQGDMFKTGQANLAQSSLPPFGDELGYYINASFVYALIPFVPRLDLEFARGAVPKGLAGTYDYSKGFTPYRGAFDPSFNQKDWAFTLRPSLTIYLASGTFIEIGDYLSFVDIPTAAILMGKSEVGQGIMNAVYVDFKWSF